MIELFYRFVFFFFSKSDKSIVFSMIDNQHNVQKGIIILWNGKFGFIETETGDSIFFHKSGVFQNYLPQIKLLDNVAFNESTKSFGKHKGDKNAVNIELLEARNILQFKRYVGFLKSWNGKRGMISSPQTEKSIRFYFTRRLEYNNSFQINEFVIFHPVKSYKDEDKLFALFAYPLKLEKDIEFLRNQYHESQQEFILQHINNLLTVNTNLSHQDKFEIEINNIGHIDNPAAFNSLKNTILKYNSSVQINYDFLKKVCHEKYLIQLFELNIIDVYDLEIIKNYTTNRQKF